MDASRQVHILIGIAFIVFTFALHCSFSGGVCERAALIADPSAERAYMYGNRHFDAAQRSEYDLDRAKYFFEEALRLNATHPYARHQLARLEFLKGDFENAERLIDQEIALPSGPTSPSSYYIRGLIRGYAGDYAGAIADYEAYLRTDSKNWAAINDYAWVLLKENRPHDALVALDWGLIYHPHNPWLLNSKATALFELDRIDAAFSSAVQASQEVEDLTEAEWLQAYPGNDPLIAREGIKTFKKAVRDNMHRIELALSEGHKNVQ